MHREVGAVEVEALEFIASRAGLRGDRFIDDDPPRQLELLPGGTVREQAVGPFIGGFDEPAEEVMPVGDFAAGEFQGGAGADEALRRGGPEIAAETGPQLDFGRVASVALDEFADGEVDVVLEDFGPLRLLGVGGGVHVVEAFLQQVALHALIVRDELALEDGLEDTAMFFTPIIKPSPSTYLNDILLTCGNLCSMLPLI